MCVYIYIYIIYTYNNNEIQTHIMIALMIVWSSSLPIAAKATATRCATLCGSVYMYIHVCM